MKHAVVFKIAGTKYSVDTPNPRNCVVARDVDGSRGVDYRSC